MYKGILKYLKRTRSKKIFLFLNQNIMNVEIEVSKIRKREQDLYKFILEKFTTYDKFNDKIMMQNNYIKDLESKIEELGKYSENLKSEMNGLEKHRDDLKSKIDELEKYREDVKSKMEGFEKHCEDVESKSEAKSPQISNTNTTAIAKENFTVNHEDVIFCSAENNITITLPTPVDDMRGKTITIINLGNTVDITTGTGVKIGGQYDKHLKNKGQSLRVVTDGSGYFTL